MSLIKHSQIHIFGKVRGVFFRASAKQQADALGVVGFAQNQPDGSLYIEAEGEEEALDKFVNWCKKSPPLARVEFVEIEEGRPKGYSEFKVL